MEQQGLKRTAADAVRKGFRTLTPYIVVQDAASYQRLLDRLTEYESRANGTERGR